MRTFRAVAAREVVPRGAQVPEHRTGRHVGWVADGMAGPACFGTTIWAAPYSEKRRPAIKWSEKLNLVLDREMHR